MKPIYKKISIAAIVVFLLIFIGGWWWRAHKPAGSGVHVLVPEYISPNMQRSDYYTITSQDKGDEKIITNVEEGASVVVPLVWQVNAGISKTNNGWILNVASLTDSQYPPDVEMILYKKPNPQRLPLSEWVRVPYNLSLEYYYQIHRAAYQFQDIQILSRPAYLITKKAIVGTDAPDTMFKENSTVQLFYVASRDGTEIFEVMCDAEGEKFKDAAEVCRTIVETKLTLP